MITHPAVPPGPGLAPITTGRIRAYFMEREKSIATDSLGFSLRVKISVGDFPHLGEHYTHEDLNGLVNQSAEHEIKIRQGLSIEESNMVVAHEVYHLFYSIRHLIRVDEETEAEAFGELVARIHAFLFD